MKKQRNKQKKIYYRLPLKWSLHYVMTDKEWREFRSRVKKVNPNWDKCSCPNGCKATSLDEQWEYDNERHIKRFVKAEFICPGCHWLKTPPWRWETWLKEAADQLPPLTKLPHIIKCLGWTKEQVMELRGKDLEQYFQQIEERKKIQKEVMARKAEIRYWKVDLSAMKQYGYSKQEIAIYEGRMQQRIVRLMRHKRSMLLDVSSLY